MFVVALRMLFSDPTKCPGPGLARPVGKIGKKRRNQTPGTHKSKPLLSGFHVNWPSIWLGNCEIASPPGGLSAGSGPAQPLFAMPLFLKGFGQLFGKMADVFGPRKCPNWKLCAKNLR